jgi:hypothetical protein
MHVGFEQNVYKLHYFLLYTSKLSKHYKHIIGYHEKSKRKQPILPYISPQIYTLIGYLSLITFPYLNNSAGTGINATARKPSKLFPQPKPNVSYIVGPASGSRAPKRQRRAVIPAMAEAANWGKQSIM